MVKKSGDEIIGFRVNPEKKRLIEMSAKAQGLTMTQLIDQALSLRLAMPSAFYSVIGKIAEAMRLPVATIISHKVIKELAWEIAWAEIFGQPSPSTTAEFQFDGHHLISGEDLFESLKEGFRLILTEAKEKIEVSSKGPVEFSKGAMESLLKGLRCTQH